MFPVQISVFISKVQVRLDPHEINVSKYNRSAERRGESSELRWKPEPLHNAAGLCYGVRLAQQPHPTLRDWFGQRTWSPVSAGPVHRPDRPRHILCLIDFAFCCQRDSESFCGQTLHFPLLPQLHLTIILNLFMHQRSHKLALKVPELLCTMPSAAQSRACLRGRCWPDSQSRTPPPHVTPTDKLSSRAGGKMFQERDDRDTVYSLSNTAGILLYHQPHS